VIERKIMGTILRGLVNECLANFSEAKLVEVIREAHKVLGDGRKVHGLFCDILKAAGVYSDMDTRKAMYARLMAAANIPQKSYGKSVSKADVFSRLDALGV
jgi:hypothetical protein